MHPSLDTASFIDQEHFRIGRLHGTLFSTLSVACRRFGWATRVEMDCPKFKEMKMTSWKRTKLVEIAKDVRLDGISIRMGAVKDYEGLDNGWIELDYDVLAQLLEGENEGVLVPACTVSEDRRPLSRRCA